MIKAKYKGLNCEELENGRVYKIKTRCDKNSLYVIVKGIKLLYSNLESFLKEWHIKAVHHGR